jgi:hypothetical protein
MHGGDNMARAYKQRATLLNVYGKEMLARLEKEYPDILWAVTVIQDKPTVVGMKVLDDKTLKPIVWGDTYELIKANLDILLS